MLTHRFYFAHSTHHYDRLKLEMPLHLSSPPRRSESRELHNHTAFRYTCLYTGIILLSEAFRSFGMTLFSPE